MITNDPECRKKIEHQFSMVWGGLSRKEYDELCITVNEIIREARKSQRFDFIPDHNRPEAFLLNLFKPLIVARLWKFLNAYKIFMVQAFQERQEIEQTEHRTVKLDETPTFQEWFQYSFLIVRSIILGDSDKDLDGLDIPEFSVEDRYLLLNSRRIKPHRDALLGQSGTHKKDTEKAFRTAEHLAECTRLSTEFDIDDIWKDMEDIKGDGFLIRDLEAQRVAAQWARKYKQASKNNPYWDEPIGYDPDYIPGDLRALLRDREMAVYVLEDWRRGESSELQTERDCMAWIESNFTGGRSLDELNKLIRERLSEVGPPDPIAFIFGKRAALYTRLRDFARAKHRDEKRVGKYIDAPEFKAIEKNQELEDMEIDAFMDDRLLPGQNPRFARFEKYLIQRDHNRHLKLILNGNDKRIYDLYKSGNSVSEIAERLNQTERNIQKRIEYIKKTGKDLSNK